MLFNQIALKQTVFAVFSPYFTNTFYFRDKIVSMKFMRKYVHIAKNMKPELTKEACDHIAEEYAKLRSQESMDQNNMAKVRLSKDFIPWHLSFGRTVFDLFLTPCRPSP